MFSFEISGRDGTLLVEGIAGSDGIKNLTYYKMSPLMAPPETICWKCLFTDSSWILETPEFAAVITECRSPIGDFNDALTTKPLIERVRRGMTHDHRS
jgi:hypothetical protein